MQKDNRNPFTQPLRNLDEITFGGHEPRPPSWGIDSCLRMAGYCLVDSRSISTASAAVETDPVEGLCLFDTEPAPAVVVFLPLPRGFPGVDKACAMRTASAAHD